MGMLSLISSLGRRFLLFCVVFLWSPLAYKPEAGSKPHRMAVLPAISRSLVEPDPENTEVMNATIAEHFLIAALIPGMMIRTPLPVWQHENSSLLWEKIQQEALPVSLSQAKWFDKLEQRDLLVGASWSCAVGSFLLVFSRKPHAATFACALLNVGIVLFTVVACYFNGAMLTPQAVAALLASFFESRATRAWSARVQAAAAAKHTAGNDEKAAATTNEKAASAAAAAAAPAAAKKSAKKKNNKTD